MWVRIVVSVELTKDKELGKPEWKWNTYVCCVQPHLVEVFMCHLGQCNRSARKWVKGLFINFFILLYFVADKWNLYLLLLCATLQESVWKINNAFSSKGRLEEESLWKHNWELCMQRRTGASGSDVVGLLVSQLEGILFWVCYGCNEKRRKKFTHWNRH